MTEEIREAKLKEIFSKYARQARPDGQVGMTFDDFESFMKESPDRPSAVRRDTLQYLWNLIDVDGSGVIDFQEFIMFEKLMNAPDADYQIAFRIFDKKGQGNVTKDDFIKTLSKHFAKSPIPFDLNTTWVNRYFGKDARLGYLDFTQVLKGLGSERWRQAFYTYDKDKKGVLTGPQFLAIIRLVNDGKVPTELKERMAEAAGLTSANAQVSYSQFVAFYYVIRDLSYHDIVLNKIAEQYGGFVTKDDLLRSSRRTASFEVTPLEVELLFSCFANKTDGRIDIREYNRVIGTALSSDFYRKVQWQAQSKPAEHKSALAYFRDSIINFGLGAIAGAIGATAVYPIDLVKTRMQNQRAVGAADRIYKNSFDCFWKTVTKEGPRGLYRGLIPQLLGVAPEKAIKLTVNDFLRDLFADRSRGGGEIYFPLEVLAGGGAGASQVIFTNPLEIVKIRLQMQGEAKRLHGIEPKSTMTIIRELGFAGLYKGAGACLLRDIPFSAIYFPTYAKMKLVLAADRPDHKPRPIDLLLAGAIAGIPAASLVTPADVIKTRLQVEARKGEQTYAGIRDCFWKVLKAEGPFAFGKGALARVFRSSPQFGVTLLSYELLHKFLAPHLPNRPPEAVVSAQDSEAFVHSRNARKLQEMESKAWLG